VIAYCGQTRERRLIAELAALGIGECTQRGELPPRRPGRWFHDNKAFSDWRGGRVFDVNRWERDQWRIRDRGLSPDFVVVPDVVAGGDASLAWSAMWRPFVAPDVPAYLVVQDGMTAERVGAWLDDQPDQYHGIFVGGTLPWKLETGAAWVAFAHGRGMRCHIGRCGTADRVRWAQGIGADSIDSCLPLRDRGKLRAFLGALGLEVVGGRQPS
jgi:hypothetical protein